MVKEKIYAENNMKFRKDEWMTSIAISWFWFLGGNGLEFKEEFSFCGMEFTGFASGVAVPFDFKAFHCVRFSTGFNTWFKEDSILDSDDRTEIDSHYASWHMNLCSSS